MTVLQIHYSITVIRFLFSMANDVSCILDVKKRQ